MKLFRFTCLMNAHTQNGKIIRKSDKIEREIKKYTRLLESL